MSSRKNRIPNIKIKDICYYRALELPLVDEIEACFQSAIISIGGLCEKHLNIEMEIPDFKVSNYEREDYYTQLYLKYRCNEIQDIRLEVMGAVKNGNNVAEKAVALMNALYMKDLLSHFSVTAKYVDSEFTVIKSRLLVDERASRALSEIVFDYRSIGYTDYKSFKKSDIKLFNSVFGVPLVHKGPGQMLGVIKGEAISRYYIRESSNYRSYQPQYVLDRYSIKSALRNDVELYLKYHKQWYFGVRDSNCSAASLGEYLIQLLEATQGDYIVADLETTGLNPLNNEIIEIAAIRCNDGVIKEEYQVLIKPKSKITNDITKLTGIDMITIERSGIELDEGLRGFVNFIGKSPVFFHNSEFDGAFLKLASLKLDLDISNPIFDTLTLARAAWPSFQKHSLNYLSESLSLGAQSHRANSDAILAHRLLRCAIAVLKKKYDSSTYKAQ